MASGHSHDDVRSHVQSYLLVFAALGLLTVVTVLVSYFPFGIAGGIIVALMVATVKGTLVAQIFMHLKSEAKGIYGLLLLTGFFLLGLFFLTIITVMSQQGDDISLQYQKSIETHHSTGGH